MKPRSATQTTFDRVQSAQVVLDLADQRGVAGVPGPAPHAQRDAVAGDGHADDDLGQVVAVVLGLAPGPEPRLLPAAPSAPSGTGLPVLVAGDRGVGLLRHEVRAGGVEEQQVDLEAEHLAGPVEDALLQGLADLQQPVHRPVACVVARRRQAR